MEENKNKSNIIKNEDSEKQRQLNDKMKIKFLNSFIIESLPEQSDDKLKEIKDILAYNNEETEESITQNENKKFEDIFEYRKELNLKKLVKRFHLFYYECKNPDDDEIIYKLGKILLFTYGKNFPKLTDFKNQKSYTSDTNWGCMIRCGQMILSRGIYRVLKSKKINTKDAIYYTYSLFNDHPIVQRNLHKYFHGMLNKFYKLTKENDGETNNKKIKEFFPPFSIKTICDFGELNERAAGEWFSDVIMTYIFKNISEYYELFNNPELNLKIMNFQSSIEIQEILNNCFIEKKYEKGNEKYIRLNDKTYYFDKMGIIFVNVRIGLDEIPKEYFKGIKELFNLKECIGIIGGKTRLAYYFIGYNDEEDSLLYLDPHLTIENDKVINTNNILSKHILKKVSLLNMSNMSTGFTIGFCFRTYEEFLNLYEFCVKAKQNNLQIFGFVKQSIAMDIKDNDKDEDDF